MKKTESRKGQVLILRTCDKDMKSYGGFQWPTAGRVEAPDWKSTNNCGNGLHGFLRGEGDGSLAIWDEDAVWIAAWVDESLCIDLRGKVKFPWAEVAKVGNLEDVTLFLKKNGCHGAIIGGTATAGDGGKATAGYRGTIVIKWWDGDRFRFVVLYVGEDGIMPNTAYTLDDNGRPVLG